MDNYHTKTVRESQFELLRIIAQWMIVFFHLFLMFTKKYQTDHPIYQGIQIPLHIGVILFVLISGYFGIKSSFKGLVRILVMTAVYCVPIALITDISNGGGGKNLIMNLLFISYTPYWFVRTYLFLYLLSPMLNKYLRDISIPQRFILIAVLTYMAVWMGTIQCDGSLAGGKNVVNFFLIYTIGNTLRTYQDKWKDISIVKMLSVYIILNILLVTIWMYFRNSIVGEGIMRISFWYCSPLLYLNAILLFMVFGRMKFTSKHINYCASSVFAIYLLHCQPYILNNIISKGAYAILNLTGAKELQTIFLFAVYAASIVVISIMIDKLLTPVWKFTSDFASKIEERTQRFMIT